MKKAFTLIELLAVIIILAVIAIIATPVVLKVVDNAKESARKSSISGYADTVRLAIVEKQFETGNNPNINQLFLDSLTHQGEKVTCEAVINGAKYGVILHVCNVGSNTNNYCYAMGRVYNCEDETYNEIYNEEDKKAVETFILTYGGSGDDKASSVISTLDGGYLLFGSTTSNDGDITGGNKGEYDIFIIKLDDNGNKLWDKTYGGSDDDVVQSVVSTSDGGYLLIGYTSSNDGDITDGNKGYTDVLIIKTDSNGNKLWDKTYGGSSADYAYSAITTTDGGYLLISKTMSNDGDITDGNNGSFDILVIKTDSNGNKLWDKTYGGSDDESISSIIATSDGGYLLFGETASNDGDITDGNNGNSDILIIKINNSGTKQWDKTYGESDWDLTSSVIPTIDGGYLLISEIITTGRKSESDALIIKLDSTLNKIWDKTYGGSNSDAIQSVIVASDGGYLLVGYTSSDDGNITAVNKGERDILVIKTNNNGNLSE